MAEKRHGEWVEAVLGLGPEWTIAGIERSPERKELRVRVAMAAGAELQCARCGKACPGYDTRRREWRHLNAWTYRTFVVCDVPRVRCPEHGVVTMQVPWAEGSSRYTAEFEADVIAWLQDASVSAVARRTKLSWNAVAWIMDAAVRRGLARRETERRRENILPKPTGRRVTEPPLLGGDDQRRDPSHCQSMHGHRQDLRPAC